jgi:1-acyl-sn-glycerol-3-phosphate acyltransferase
MKLFINGFAPFMTWLAGARIERTGMENIPEGAALFAGNHQSYIDAARIVKDMGKPKSIVLKKELTKIPVVKQWMDSLGCIYIEREDPRRAVETMKEMEERLEAGRSVIIFPEGTRSKGPQMGEFKYGALKSALKAKVPVVPFAIDGAYMVYEAHKRLRPAVVKFAILPPIMPEEFEGMNTRTLGELVESRIKDELARMRAESPSGK